MEADNPPCQTIYVQNLNEKTKKEELKKELYNCFSKFGRILDVVALKTLKMRGQAFIVFEDVSSATNALREMQDHPFMDKPMKIAYAKSKSDAVARIDGTYEDQKRKRDEKKASERTEDQVQKKTKKESSASDAAQKAALNGNKAANKKSEAPAEPNKILFVQNLPNECNDLMLSMLFQQFEGFREARLVPGKSGIAFVEFESEVVSTEAMNGLQNFKITPTNLMHITYAKK